MNADRTHQFRLVALLGVIAASEPAFAIVGDDLSGDGYITIYSDHDESGNSGVRLKAGQAGIYGSGSYPETTIAQFGVGGVSEINTNTSVFGTLNVSSATTLSNSLAVSGAATLSNSLAVSGAATLSNSLAVSGAATLSDALTVSGATVVNNSLQVSNASGANLNVNTTGNQASLTASGGQGLVVGGSSFTQLKGGTNSGTLNLRDGDATGSALPNGSSLTISGSSGSSSTSTVFQATTTAAGNNVQTLIGTSATTLMSTATLQAGANGVTVNSGNLTGTGAAVTINGAVSNGTSRTGVLITGSGQNGVAYSSMDRAAGVTPSWADVAIQSNSYGLGDPTLGSAILVTDYGIQLISAQPAAGQQITNSAGVNSSTGLIVNNNGSNTSSGSVINNNGMNSGSGSVVNNSGGISGSGSASNNIGMNTSTIGGVATNNIGGVSGNGVVTNGFGNNTSTTGGIANNTIGVNSGNGQVTNSFGGGSGASTNNIGTGTGISNNTIGNATIGSSVTSLAGNTQSYMANGVATTTVASGGGLGGSILAGGTTTRGNSVTVLKDASASHVVVNPNGQMSIVSGAVGQTSSAMTVTNGYGAVHGFYVDERQSTMSGGTKSSSLTLNDNGATFSNSATGAPIGIHGVADGKSPHDAVNVRQLFGGIAASMAAAPVVNDLERGETGIGFGMGHYGGYSAAGFGLSRITQSGVQMNFGVSRGLQTGTKTAIRGSVGIKF
jgi:hypothetical protein